jgi:hypothetical protein
VRQALLQKMMFGLGYPKGLISVERAIGERRYDIVCFSPQMAPLLLVECKAEHADEAAIQQALGYNGTIKAPFICLATAGCTVTYWYERGELKSVPFLPAYQELCVNGA